MLHVVTSTDLPLGEHPLDTLCVCLPRLCLLFVPYTRFAPTAPRRVEVPRAVANLPLGGSEQTDLYKYAE